MPLPLAVSVTFLLTVAAEPTPPADDKSAVVLARAALEYRDLDKVIEVLDPWLHPVRIADPALLIEARRILGVAYALLDRNDEAKDELSELLLLDPDHKLDPFYVPPKVILMFERLREDMRPLLERIQPPRAGPPPTASQLVEVPPRATMYLPFGAPQFLLEQPGWGVFWLTLQIASLALNIGAHRRGVALLGAGTEADIWLGLQYAGIAGFVGGWLGSVVLGHRALDDLRATAVPQGRVRLRPSDTGVQLRFSF